MPGGTASSALGTVNALRDRARHRMHRCSGVPSLAAARRRGRPRSRRGTSVCAARCSTRVGTGCDGRASSGPRVESTSIHATGMAIPPKSAPLAVTVHDLAFVDYPEHATRHGLRFFHRSLVLTERDADRGAVPFGCDQGRVDRAGYRRGPDPSRAVGRRAVRRDRRRHRSRAGRAMGYAAAMCSVGRHDRAAQEPRRRHRGLPRAAGRRCRRCSSSDRTDGTKISRLGSGRRSAIRALGFVPRDELLALYAGAAASATRACARASASRCSRR